VFFGYVEALYQVSLAVIQVLFELTLAHLGNRLT
jgi:hypothetical protein